MRTFARHLFIYVAVVAVVLKMWLTAEIRIIPAYGPHDMSNFIAHARSITAGLWFGTYNDLTLIKRPFLPIYLSILHDFGIPLPLGHTLLYAFACLVACLSIRPMVKGQAPLAVIFVVLLFNPFTYNIDAWVLNRSQVSPSAALIVIASAIAIFLRRREGAFATLPWAVGLGLSLSAFWLTREEAIWIVPCLLVYLGAYAVLTVRKKRPEWATRAVILLLPAAIWGTSIAAVMMLNGRYYGWYTIDEQTAPELASAYNSLARIDVAPVPFVPVPKAAREIAYRVSPAAKELQPGFDGPQTGWIGISCRVRKVCTDYGGGYFIWAFRDAVSNAGHYTSGANARAFYLDLARQIDGACNSKSIACRAKAITTLPPVHLSDIPSIAAYFVSGMNLAGTFFGTDPLGIEVSIYGDPPPNIRHDYDVITESVANTSDQRVFSGWLLHKRVKTVVAEGPNGEVEPVQFAPSPDVFRAFKGDREYDQMNSGSARFSVTVHCAPTCDLAATMRDNTQVRFPLDHDFKNADLFYHVDDATINSPYDSGDDRFKTSILEFVSRAYQTIVPWCLLVSIALLLWRMIELTALRRPQSVDYVLVIVGVGAGCCTLVLLLAVMSALSYACFVPEYMSPVFPFLLFASAFAIIVELQNMYQTLFSPKVAPAILHRSAPNRPGTSSID